MTPENHDAQTACRTFQGPRRLAVALVTETYPPEVNGVALTVERVVAGLRKRAHRVQVIRPRQVADNRARFTDEAGDLLVRGLPIPRYPQLRMGLPARRVLAASWSVRRPDVVHIATEGPLGWSALRAARQLNLPVVSDFRTDFQSYSRHYGIGALQGMVDAYLRSFHNQTDRTLVPTNALSRRLQQSGYRDLAVVSRGIDTCRFSPDHRSEALRCQWGANPGTLVVMCVGRLAPEKNLETLCDAFEVIRGHGADARLVFVGDGPSRKALQARCAHAVFAGMKTGQDLSAHYASADLFIFPSLTETFGNVTLEAMASGLPVLAFDHAAAGALIQHEVNGLLATVHDRDGLLSLAASWSRDRARLGSLGAAARLTACSMDWERIIDQVESILTDVARSPVMAL